MVRGGMMTEPTHIRLDAEQAQQEIESLKAGREEAVKLVLDAGLLSTGHADTCGDLMLEVLGEIESLSERVKTAEARSDEAVQEYQSREIEWKRRAREIYDRGVRPVTAANWFEEE